MAQTHSSVRATAALRRLVALALIGGSLPASAQEAPGEVSTEDVTGCWRIEVDPWPEPWPFSHLWSPGLLPEAVRLSPERLVFVPIPGDNIPEGARVVAFPAGYRRSHFRYWIPSGSEIKMRSASPSGQRISASPSGRDRFTGTLTSYGAGDYWPRPEPQEWTVGVTLSRTTCEGFG